MEYFPRIRYVAAQLRESKVLLYRLGETHNNQYFLDRHQDQILFDVGAKIHKFQANFDGRSIQVLK